MVSSTSNVQQSRDRLVEIYRNLPPLEQTMVQLFSVIYEPISRALFVNCWNWLPEKDRGGKHLTPPNAKPYINGLIEKGVLIQPAAAGPQCHPLIAEIVTRDAVKAKRFERLVQAVQKGFPVPRRWKDGPISFSNERQLIREVRLGIYRNDLKFINKQFEDYYRYSYQRDELSPVEVFLQVCHIKRLKDIEHSEPQLPSTLQAGLRDYQIEGFRWLAHLAHWGVGACLADDMGLGKTLQALALILTRAPEGPTLVVAPTSVGMNWLSEAQRFAPTLNPIQFGSGNRQNVLDQLKPFDLLVCSYGLLQQEDVAEMLAKVQWPMIVLDEAQSIKNFATKRSQAAMNLQGGFKLITTGTPIENHLGELWNLFRFINPGLLGSLESFNERFAVPIERYGDRLARTRLKKLIQPFLLRRTKNQVLEELPSRTEILLQVELSKEELTFYEALRRDEIAKLAESDATAGAKHLQVLAEIMRLRRACCNTRLVNPEITLSSAKLQLFGEVLIELLENKHKALVFSQFVDHLHVIRDYLDSQKISYQYLDGSTSTNERKKRVNAFQAGEGDVFLISLKAGGVGLNLTAADYVIHMDPWWNPAVEDQASDRAHRIGQQRPVTIYRLVAKNTIEEKIVDLHQHKRDLADSLLEGTEMSGKISTDELLRLISEG